MLRQLLDVPTRCYGARARTELSMEGDRPSSEDLLLQMGNTEANVSRGEKKKEARIHAQHHVVNLIEALSSSL